MNQVKPLDDFMQNLTILNQLRIATDMLQSAKGLIERMSASTVITTILVRLGLGGGGSSQDKPADKPAPIIEPAPAPIEPEVPTTAQVPEVPAEPEAVAQSDTPRIPTSPMVDRSVIPMAKRRQGANNQAVALLAHIKAEGLNRDDLTEEQLATLAQYTGSGGGLKSKDGVKGSAYEYYTPKEVAQTIWSIAEDLGFSGGKVLDPSAGTGIFTSTSPENAVVDSIELDSVSGGIAQVLNDGARSNTIISPFEKLAESIAEDSLDMVVTNVPFGDNATRGSNKTHDTAYQNESLENYFILRSLGKVKHGGLAIFVTPTSVVSGKEAAKTKLRRSTSAVAEFLGAYRLPTSIFEQTGADVVTDIVIYRKHSREAIDQIKELRQAGDIDTLTATGVFWEEYLSGLYFKGAGKKFVLGENTTKIDRWGKEVDTVFSTKPTPEVLKAIKKKEFKSRIDWDALGAAEAATITYNDGDVIFQDGKQLEYQGGRFHVMEKAVTDTDREMQDRLAVMGSALDMVIAGLTFEQVESVITYGNVTGQAGLIPQSVMGLIARTKMTAPENRHAAWNCVIAKQAIEDVIAEHEYGYNFVTGEPILTAFLKTAFLDGKNVKIMGDAKQDHKLVAMYYAAGTYNVVWRGEVNTVIDDTAAASGYQSVLARIQYENKSLHLSREQLAQIDPDADPVTNDDWFINHDGTSVIAANDFLIGNLADRLADIDKQLEQATDDDIRAKLFKQKDIARSSVSRIDIMQIDMDLRTPLISAEDKVRFLKQNVHPDAFVSYDEFGRGTADIDVKAKGGRYSDIDEGKLTNRIGDWISRGTVTLGGVELSTMTEKEGIEWLTKKINTANIEFNSWVKASKNIMDALERQTSDEKNLFFTQNADESPIDIAGLNPKLNLHGYQNAFVRQQGRFFGGINGMGVGLGKTFSSLASVKHIHNIGAKKKTIFLVPNSVLSNWRKEAKFAYESMDDCIFIGLREYGDKFRVISSKYDEDLLTAVDSKYRKIFMTYEAFRRLRLKEDTIVDYTNYVKDTDNAFVETLVHKDKEKLSGLTADMIARLKVSSNAPYLEDMGVDSVVIDEAHSFKNSISAPKTDGGIKYLSQPELSVRGEDAQAKLWYVRSLTVNKDGVQLLTATPITNSPLEIYSMLSLASGRDTINKMCGGIKGADDFIQVMCQIEEETVPTIDGGTRSQNVFTGIRNAQILRGIVRAQATIKDAKDVGMSVVIPDRETVATGVVLSDAINKDLKMMQDAYAVARQMTSKNGLEVALQNAAHPLSPFNPNSPISLVMKRYGEPLELVAHPFNLIRKMDVMIADAEFSDMATFYDFEAAQEKIAIKVIEQFNKKPLVNERDRLSPYTDPDDATAIYVKDGDEKVLKGYKIKCKAKIVLHEGRKRIVIDTLNGKTQSAFETLADKEKLNLDVTVSAKLAALLENLLTEQASPRGILSDGSTSPIVKQIIFCDHLFLHNKIKKLVAKRCGVSASKIAIITGQINNQPDEMIDIQEGFNGHGEENRYQVIIANKKAEVGINLQHGTQAIHHLTTGWTPDSLEQRNGRGARQGNLTDSVRIYHYDADGTFDEFKRTMIDKKDEWITSVLNDDGKNTIKVSGGISREEQDALITVSGNKEAMSAYLAGKDAKEVEARRNTAIRNQEINLQVIDKQTALMRNLSPESFYEQAVIDVISLIRDNRLLRNKNENPKTSKSAVEKGIVRYEQSKAIALDKLADILNDVSVIGLERVETKYNFKYEPDGTVSKPTMSANDAYDYLIENSGDFKPSATDEWRGRFGDRIVLKDASAAYKRVKVNEDSFYQSMFDDTKSTAEGLINQSVIAANSIAKETGIDGISLPANAGELIAQKEATMVRGVFVQVGAFIDKIADNALCVVNKDFKAIRLTNKPRYGSGGNPDTDPVRIEGDSLEWMDLPNMPVANPYHSDYLAYVKRAAVIEDNYHGKSLLGEVGAAYSAIVPIVAEYRDASITPKYAIGEDMRSKHAKITNGVVGIMLPLSILKTGTAFAQAMLNCYKNNGFDIDLENGTFSADNSLTVETNHYSAYKNEDTYIAAIADLIKLHKVAIEDADWDLAGMPEALIASINVDGEKLVSAVDEMEAAITHETDADDLEAMVISLFSRIGYAKQFSFNVSNPSRLRVLNTVMGTAKGSYGNYFDILRSLYAAHAKAAREHNYAKAIGGAVDDTISDTTTVYIGGDTKTNYKHIKAYSKDFDASSPARWNGAKGVWTMKYGAYKNMVKAQPSLATMLTMTTDK